MELRREIRVCADDPDAVGAGLISAAGGDGQVSRIAKAAVYLPADSKTSDEEVRRALAEAGHHGAVEVVYMDSPEYPGQALLLAWTAPGDADLRTPCPDVTAARSTGREVVWFGNSGAGADFDAVLDAAERKLTAAGMGLAHLWKTWSYLPVDRAGEAAAAFIEFNERRARWFAGVEFDIAAAHGHLSFAYPANTGVGDLSGRFSLSGIAGRVDGPGRAIEIDNPRQQAPRAYGSNGSGRPAPAQFSRAVAVSSGTDRWLLVAGTASVVGSNTVGGSAVAAQTGQTLTNLGLLAERFHGDPEPGPIRQLHAGYDNLTVYVTHSAHYPEVREAVGAQAPGVPAVYLLSPLTRTDLLVEIEGELAR